MSFNKIKTVAYNITLGREVDRKVVKKLGLDVRGAKSILASNSNKPFESVFDDVVMHLCQHRKKLSV